MSSNNPTGRPRACVAVFACVTVFALVLDRITKMMALESLDTQHSVPVIPGLLSLRLLHNPGASLGMGSSMTWAIALLAIVMSAAILVAGLYATSMRWSVCLGLALAGAMGNLIDRIIYAKGVLDGSVVDFLDYGWSVGNVADIWLMAAGIGLVVLVFMSVPLRTPRREDDAAPSTTEVR
ncbi:signal peptidase II [Bifidobacterium catulorum]|uniref:Lipoprotein signal peptidase n=1 Tax=Bifidobacterium catulorum TaxID=1630173 RepID=A0A2U2MS90_9BIFI|nr:signal peptidase II [Bifidobacterium catulorum]PWG59726.1 lipoprotein signal peptidase [Bifidobacterium catulorum]